MVPNIIYLIYIGSRSEQVREKLEPWTELAGSVQWFEVRTKVLYRTSATPSVEIIYVRGVGYHLLQRSTTGLSYLKKRTTHTSSGPSAQWTTVCINSLLYWRENYLILRYRFTSRKSFFGRVPHFQKALIPYVVKQPNERLRV